MTVRRTREDLGRDKAEVPSEPGLRGTDRWTWSDASSGVEVRFWGKPSGDSSGRPSLSEELTALLPAGVAGGWARQVHSATVLAGCAGEAGEGDALIGREAGLALSVVTADCVPVLLAAGEWVAAVHAGWRGIASGVLRATAERLTAAGAPAAAGWTAWIGPAIGACCYEVGPEVAERVAAASDGAVVRSASGGEVSARPYLDLFSAVRVQLARAGVGSVRSVDLCTFCNAGTLWSYRRDGAGAGRNVAAVWRVGGRAPVAPFGP